MEKEGLWQDSTLCISLPLAFQAPQTRKNRPSLMMVEQHLLAAHKAAFYSLCPCRYFHSLEVQGYPFPPLTFEAHSGRRSSCCLDSVRPSTMYPKAQPYLGSLCLRIRDRYSDFRQRFSFSLRQHLAIKDLDVLVQGLTLLEIWDSLYRERKNKRKWWTTGHRNSGKDSHFIYRSLLHWLGLILLTSVLTYAYALQAATASSRSTAPC